MTERWKLVGYDTFAGEYYSLNHPDYPFDDLDGAYASEEEALKAAKEYLGELEQDQPASSSGGQAEDGIQDRVFMVTPDGTMYRVVPEISEKVMLPSSLLDPEPTTSSSMVAGPEIREAIRHALDQLVADLRKPVDFREPSFQVTATFINVDPMIYAGRISLEVGSTLGDTQTTDPEELDFRVVVHTPSGRSNGYVFMELGSKDEMLEAFLAQEYVVRIEKAILDLARDLSDENFA